MKRMLTMSCLPALALVGACGGGGNEIVTTNANNVVLNDAQGNFAFTNDGEQTANDAAMANDVGMTNDSGMAGEGAMDGTMTGTTSNMQ